MKLKFFFVTEDKYITIKYGTPFNRYFNKIMVFLELDTSTGEIKITGKAPYDPALEELLPYYGYKNITPIIEKLYKEKEPYPLNLLEIDLSKIKLPLKSLTRLIR